MLKVQFDGDMLVVRPEGAITREDVTTLTRTADDYLTDHPKITGVVVETRTFPGFASVGAFADYARFIANHHARVRRLALVPLVIDSDRFLRIDGPSVKRGSIRCLRDRLRSRDMSSR